MNIVPAIELKRRGMAALEQGLRNGPVHIVKRNRPAAVVLTEEEYQRLLERAGEAVAAPQLTALQWLTTLEQSGQRSQADIDAQVDDERNHWPSR